MFVVYSFNSNLFIKGDAMKSIFLLSIFLLSIFAVDNSYAKDITEGLEEGDEVVLIFSTSWCGPCRLLKARLSEETELVEVVQGRFGNRLYILDAEAQQYVGLASRLRIRSYPTVLRLVYRNSKLVVVRRFMGMNLTARWLNTDL